MEESKKITTKVKYILTKDVYNKVSLCSELGISRPTLDAKLLNNKWKLGEISLINKIYNKIINESS